MGNDRHEIKVLSCENGVMIAKVGEHLMKVFSPSGITEWSMGYDQDRWFKSVAEAERHHEARSDFMDELAGLFAIAIQHGMTEEELRADFEAQLSLQAFDDKPDPVSALTPRQAIAKVYQEMEGSTWREGDAERLIRIQGNGWTYSDTHSNEHGSVTCDPQTGTYTVEFAEHPHDREDFPRAVFLVTQHGRVSQVK